MFRKDRQLRWFIVVGAVALPGAVIGCRSGAAPQGPPVQQQRVAAIRTQGARASLTIFPIVMVGDAHKDVADVLALMLETAGMSRLDTTDSAYRSPVDVAFDESAAAFGAFVRDRSIGTDYAMYAEVFGTPDTGATEIRFVIVDATGQTVLSEVQTPQDSAFKRAKPRDPMTCCQFLAERITTYLAIPASARDASGKGKFARMFAENSPVPADVDLRAMEPRQSAMKAAGRQARVVVLPVRISNDEADARDATMLAERLRSDGLCDARASESPLHVKLEPTKNEQKRLWSVARALQEHVKQDPPEADYVLLADYVMRPDRAWAVHFVVCDRSGEWVIVDFQNDHHADFQSIDPKTHDDCGRLVAKRLAKYVR